MRQTVREWVRQAEQRLADAGIESPRLEGQVLAAHAMGCTRSEVVAHPEWEAPPAAEALLVRRLGHEPLAYIVGYREFYGRRFKVTPDVLIPRQETETLIDAFSALAPSLPEQARVLDLGTGSGCIGITLKLEHPSLKVVLSDVSERALTVARKNAEALGADVELVLGDGFDIFRNGERATRSGPGEGERGEGKGERWEGQGSTKGTAFDLIVSNPPYVAESDKLPDEVRLFEPANALFSGPNGLEFYRRLAAEAGAHLRPGGLLLLEVGDTQAQAVRGVFAGWKEVGAFRDLIGVERALAFRRTRP